MGLKAKRVKRLLLIMIVLSGVLYGQQRPMRTVEDALRAVASGTEVKKLSESHYEVKEDGRTFHFSTENFDEGEYHRKAKNSTPIDTISYDIFALDSIPELRLFNKWIDTDAFTVTFKVPCFEDFNNNGRIEYYAERWNYWPNEPFESRGVVKEFNPTLNIFEDYHSYSELFNTYNVYDWTGEKRLYCKYVDQMETDTSLFYRFRNSDFTGLPFEVESDIPRDSRFFSAYDTKVGDFNRDGIPDLMVFTDRPDTAGWSTVIAQYVKAEDRFDSVFSYNHLTEVPGAELGVGGDLDGDGYAELTYGDQKGNVKFIEYNPQLKKYQIVYETQVRTWHAYYSVFTEDMDGNGRDEIWIGGSAFYSDFPITRFTAFESSGDNSYYPAYVMDLPRVFQFSGWSRFINKDVDGNGSKEMVLQMLRNLMMLEGSGDGTKNFKFVGYLPPPENFRTGGYGFQDIDRDGEEELVRTVIEFGTDPLVSYGRYFTYFYKWKRVLGVEEEGEATPTEFTLSQNYPNPFNPSTTIEYSIATEGIVELKVYSMLGEEVATLVNEVKQAGSYTTDFNASNLPSGMYIYTIQSEGFSLSKKLLLIK